MKKLLCFSMLALSLTATSLATAQDYPVRPIKMIVPFPPAGGTDNVARIVAQQVSQDLGQSIIIENRAGAAGMIGADAVAKAEPDGYTIVLTTNSTHVIGPLLNPKTPYSPTKSFSPVIYLAQSPSIMVVPVSSPAKTVKEFIELAKKNPGKLNYGSAGNGGIPHLSGERFQALSGINMAHVPYKGTALAIFRLPTSQRRQGAGFRRFVSRSLALGTRVTSHQRTTAGFHLYDLVWRFWPCWHASVCGQ
ncbi:MAG: hypothetical protein RI994_1810 [Pseudomonadota bacterium]